MKTVDIEVIGKTLNKAYDLVTPTMGPRGRLAILADPFSRPYLTDDGVTVAKELLKLDNQFERMVAISICEAAGNTEKAAFDGTTLTVLLVKELYECGMKLVKQGVHQQIAADIVKSRCENAVKLLKNSCIKITDANKEHLIKSVSYITTKIPYIGELVYEAAKKAGDAMNIAIEHDRTIPESVVEHVDGMVVNSGYFSKELGKLANNEKGVWIRDNAKIFLLAEGILTKNGLNNLFKSITNPKQPLVFAFSANHNPETIQQLIENLSANHLDFMIMFINEGNADEIFLDIAAKTNGMVQSATFNTTDYTYDHAGTVDHIEIEIDKTTIIAKGDEEAIKNRMSAYKRELDENKFTTNLVRADVINRRMANLGAGVVTIKLACQTVTEYRTIRFKLDDAIGAVRCTMRDGVLPGCGKAMYYLTKPDTANEVAEITDALKAPMKKILANAGYGMPSDEYLYKLYENGIDATNNAEVNLYDEGILDSYASIETALKNAASIACDYLRAYILINENVKEGD